MNSSSNGIPFPLIQESVRGLTLAYIGGVRAQEGKLSPFVCQSVGLSVCSGQDSRTLTPYCGCAALSCDILCRYGLLKVQGLHIISGVATIHQ